PARPALPEIATAPAGHYQNSLMIREIEELLGFEFAFEADRVQPHVAHVTKFVLQALGVFAEHHVGSPAATTDQDVFAVDVEGASARGVHFRSYLANAEVALGMIAGLAIDLKCYGQGIKIRLAHLRGPPQTRIGEDELG